MRVVEEDSRARNLPVFFSRTRLFQLPGWWKRGGPGMALAGLTCQGGTRSQGCCSPMQSLDVNLKGYLFLRER